MMLIFFILVAVFQPSIASSKGPFIYDNHTQSITVEEGESVQLECYAGGETNAPIKWHRERSTNSTNRNLILPNGEKSYYGNILELPSITRHQRGMYICSATEQYGSASRYIGVTVNFKPIIIETYRIIRFESNELELRCNAESEPPAEVRWYKNDSEMNPNDNYEINNNRKFGDTLYSTFIELSYNFDENNIYKCVIENPLGIVIVSFPVTDEEYSP